MNRNILLIVAIILSCCLVFYVWKIIIPDAVHDFHARANAEALLNKFPMEGDLVYVDDVDTGCNWGTRGFDYSYSCVKSITRFYIINRSEYLDEHNIPSSEFIRIIYHIDQNAIAHGFSVGDESWQDHRSRQFEKLNSIQAKPLDKRRYTINLYYFNESKNDELPLFETDVHLSGFPNPGTSVVVKTIPKELTPFLESINFSNYTYTSVNGVHLTSISAGYDTYLRYPLVWVVPTILLLLIILSFVWYIRSLKQTQAKS